MLKLFAVYLGGRIPGCHIEMHDVQFSVGECIEDCYEDLQSKRVGKDLKCHIDAFLELKYVDGYEVVLTKQKSESLSHKLYFINAGGYVPEKFGELHEIGFYVAQSAGKATVKALEVLCNGQDKKHQDDLYDVDDCIALEQVNEYHIQLIPTDKTQDFRPMCFGYRPMNEPMSHKIVHYNYK